MIPATRPVTSEAYAHWTPVRVECVRTGPGAFRAAVEVRRSRLLADGTTELHPDPAERVSLTVPDVYAPPYAGEESPSHGPWWTAEVRATCVAWAAAGGAAVAAVGSAQGVL